jgi:hypothetical protein
MCCPQVKLLARREANVVGMLSLLMGSCFVTPISLERPDALHMCARIYFHTYDKQNECNIIDSKNVTRGLTTCYTHSEDMKVFNIGKR